MKRRIIGILLILLIPLFIHAGILKDLLDKAKFVLKLDLSEENQTTSLSDGEGKKFKAKNVNFFFELSSPNYEVSKDKLQIPAEFREDILTHKIFLFNFFNEFELLNFMIYLPPVHIQMLNDFLNGEVDDRFRVSTLNYSDLTDLDKAVVVEMSDIINRGISTPDNLSEVKFYDIVSQYNLNLTESGS